MNLADFVHGALKPEWVIRYSYKVYDPISEQYKEVTDSITCDDAEEAIRKCAKISEQEGYKLVKVYNGNQLSKHTLSY